MVIFVLVLGIVFALIIAKVLLSFKKGSTLSIGREEDFLTPKEIALSRLRSEDSRRKYGDAYRLWGDTPLTFSNIIKFIADGRDRGLSPSTLNGRLAAVKQLAKYEETLASDERARILGIRGDSASRVRLGRWLSTDQTAQLLAAPPADTLRGKRDRALLACLVGVALRRTELVKMTFAHLGMVQGRWVFADFTGKGRKIRSAPIPQFAAERLIEWTTAAGIKEGALWRKVHGADTVSEESISADHVHTIVSAAGREIGISLAPHDLRRTSAHLSLEGGADIHQVQHVLGHSSIATTERYLNRKLETRLGFAACDQINL